MLVSINNFRGIQEKTINLPEKGVVRIEGDSESGKTTTIESILWGFYGNDATKNVTPLTGSKSTKTKVTIEYNNLVIDRCKVPVSLDVNEKQNEEAQGLIDNVIANANNFMLGGYIQQKMKGCFLTLQPKEQLNFLTQLALDVDIDKLKQATTVRIKNSETVIDKLNDECQYLLNDVTSIASQIESYNISDYSNIDNILEEKNRTITSHENDIFNNNQQLEQLRKIVIQRSNEMLNPLYNIANEISIFHDTITKDQKTLNDIIKVEQPKPIDTSNYNNITNRINLIRNTFIPFLISIQEVDLRTLQADINTLMINIQNKRNEFASVKKQLDNAGVPLHCPHCNGKLSISDDSIIAFDSLEIDIPKISSLLEKLKSEGITLKSELDKKTLIKDKLNSLRELGLEDKSSDTYYKELNDLIVIKHEYDTGIDMYNKQLNDYNNYINRVNMVQNLIETNTKKMQEKIVQRDNLHLVPIVQIQAEISQHQVIISSVQDTNTLLSQTLSQTRKEKDELVKTQAQVKYIIQLQDNLAQKKAKYQGVVNQIDIEQQKLTTLNSILIKLNKAQLSSLESVTDSLNTQAQIYLAEFFPDCNTIINIQPFKQNKDGTFTDKVGIEIYHRGVKFDSLDKFSGGAENRAILAFQLAVADLLNLPMVFLDEPLTGVQNDLREEIYEVVKRTSSHRLIVLAEHNLPEHIADYVV